MIIIKEISPVLLLKDFNEDEFRCSCGCGLYLMKPIFLYKLQQTRTEAQVPFVISSGTRCAKHNADVGGKKNSEHLIGWASDVSVKDSTSRFKIVRAAISVGFSRIGIGSDFVHLGDSPAHPRGVLWTY